MGFLTPLIFFLLNNFYIFIFCQTHFCRYMDYAITVSPFAFNETNVIEAVAEASEVGRYVAKDFLINNWQAVSKR